MVFGQFSLWYLADFHYGIWPIFIMVFGRFSLWYLADFRQPPAIVMTGDYRKVAVGET